MSINCYECRKSVSFDEAAMNRKMISNSVSQFLCLSCLAKRYNMSEDVLKEKIEYLKKSGCTLFSAPSDGTDGQ